MPTSAGIKQALQFVRVTIASTSRLACFIFYPISTVSHPLFTKLSLLKLLNGKMHSAETSFLVGPENTKVTTKAKPDFQLPTKTWTITEKLEEASLFINQIDFNGGLKPGFSVGKFLCKDDTTQELAFMRVYYQIPTSGTEWSASTVRAAQAVPSIKLAELVAFKALIEQACPVVPRLLGYQEGKQLDDGIILGGLFTTIVWEKVAGGSIIAELFLNFSDTISVTNFAGFTSKYISR